MADLRTISATLILSVGVLLRALQEPAVQQSTDEYGLVMVIGGGSLVAIAGVVVAWLKWGRKP